MKIAVYEIDRVAPNNANEEEFFCEILNTSSLKTGFAEFVGRLSQWISKGELKKLKTVDARFFDRSAGCWRDGQLFTEVSPSGKKLFAQYASL